MRLSRDNLVLLGIVVVMTATYVLLVYRTSRVGWRICTPSRPP